MKQSKRCPKCTSNRIGVIQGVYDEWSISLGNELAGLGIEIPAGAKATSSSDLSRTAYLCADCGYYETYVDRPDKIDYEKLKGAFSWLNPQTGPFR